MRLRPLWLLCSFTCFGCQCLVAPEDAGADSLSRAIAFLEKGDDFAACAEMEKYLQANPTQYLARAYYAELLVRLGRVSQAKTEFESFIAEAQNHMETTASQQIRCHSRLMDIAEAEDDTYAVHLHRGIGLYLLARERSQLDDPAGPLPMEGLLCRAADALSAARSSRPEQAQPCWYLYQVWSALGQRQPALHWLRRAGAAAAFAPMTAAEQRGLQLALRQQEMNSPRP
jgi:tetratricopeptide (TPR) repeat protein